jgi:hypothetical protein
MQRPTLRPVERNQESIRRESSSLPSETSITSMRWLIVCAAVLLSAPYASSFQVYMTYKPPVKSSVKKLFDQRSPNNSETRTSKKSAYAGAYAPSQPSSSPISSTFERRMRDKVLGDASKSRQSSTGELRRGLPSNVQHVETLQEYKKVVGDEKEKMVAVRFYATYCAVSEIVVAGRACERSNIVSNFLFSIAPGVQSCCTSLLSPSNPISRLHICGCTCDCEECCIAPRARRTESAIRAHLSPSRRPRGRD